MTTSPRHALPILSLALLTTLTSCVSDEAVFTDGRIEDVCNSSIPVCATQAACILQDDEFYRSEFPGGVRMIVRSETENAKLIVRVLLTEPIFPGTEFRIQAHTPGCGQFDEGAAVDVDLFEFFGDDRTVEYELEIPGRGDHLLEGFSDMSSTYLLTTEVVE